MVMTVNGRNEYINTLQDALYVIQNCISYDLGDYMAREITDYDSELDAVWRMYEEEEKEKKKYMEECHVLESKLNELNKLINTSADKSVDKSDDVDGLPF